MYISLRAVDDDVHVFVVDSVFNIIFIIESTKKNSLLAVKKKKSFIIFCA